MADGGWADRRRLKIQVLRLPDYALRIIPLFRGVMTEPEVIFRVKRDITQTVESKLSGKPFKASTNKLAPKQVAIGALCGLTTLFVLGAMARTAYFQRRALSQWKAVPNPSGPIGKSEPRMHTPAFWSVMQAFDLEHGDSAEEFLAILGQPDHVEPVTWYFYIKETVNGKGRSQPVWIVKNQDAFVIAGHVKRLEAQRYTWKYDHYYWPRPKGQ